MSLSPFHLLPFSLCAPPLLTLISPASLPFPLFSHPASLSFPLSCPLPIVFPYPLHTLFPFLLWVSLRLSLFLSIFPFLSSFFLTLSLSFFSASLLFTLSSLPFPLFFTLVFSPPSLTSLYFTVCQAVDLFMCHCLHYDILILNPHLYFKFSPISITNIHSLYVYFGSTVHIKVDKIDRYYINYY